MAKRNEVNALLRGIISLWVVGAGMTAQLALALTLECLPTPVAFLWGVGGMILVLPGLCSFILGILGTPLSWVSLFFTTIRLFLSRGVLGLLELLATVWQSIVFRPFECPDTLAHLPWWIKAFFFRESTKIYAPMSSTIGRQDNRQNDNVVQDDEYWIFINGVATNRVIAEFNRDHLSRIVKRPCWLCHNPTDGLLVDLLECITDKVGIFDRFWLTQPRQVLRAALYQALMAASRDRYKRVVVVAHSQGTILTSRVLQDLAKVDNKLGNYNNNTPSMSALMKRYLEVYNFANCAHTTCSKNVRHLENLTNGRDTVAWLGALFPFPRFWEDVYGKPVHIEGNKEEEAQAWGHLFSTHYLDPLEHGAFPESRLSLLKVEGVAPAQIIAK